MKRGTSSIAGRTGRPGAAARPGAAGIVALIALLTVAALVACSGDADVFLQGRLLDSHTEGSADDASGWPPAESYASGERDLWAQDSLTTAYSDRPRPGRLAGGVAAQPVDTATGAEVTYATARSLNRMTVPLEVRSGGRVELQIQLQLADVEVSGSGVPRVEVSGLILDDDGTPVPGGDMGTLTLQVRPDGAVVIDQLPDETDELQPNGRYTRLMEGPVGGVELARGRYRVEVGLALEATAPTASGPFQLARIGQAIATLQVP